MKIEIEIPDWCEEKNLYILAGVDLVAYRHNPNEKWMISDSRCSLCGKCCTGLPLNWPFPTINGECINLEKERAGRRLCTLGVFRPHRCGTSPDGLFKNNNCTVRFVEY